MNKFRRTLSTNKDVELHMAIGLCTEAGELLDAYKKGIFYGRGINLQNVREEIGDIVWYLEILMDEIGYSYEEAKEDVIQKLAKRYPEKFEDVVIRDVNTELSHIKS
jgi:NTP pyrophosphatase (non-canonical NTP hydrolase)